MINNILIMQLILTFIVKYVIILSIIITIRYTPEHCMVLVGGNDKEAYVADPATGKIMNYDKKLLETRYKELFTQAVVIQ